MKEALDIDSIDSIVDKESLVIKGAPELLQLSSLDELVGLYDDMKRTPEYLNGEGAFDAEKADAALAEVFRDRLADAGLREGGTDNEQRRYDVAYRALQETARSNRGEWFGEIVDGAYREGPRNEIYRSILEEYVSNGSRVGGEATGSSGEDDVAKGSPEDHEGTEIEKLQKELKAARDTWAAMQAKRQGRMGDRHIKGYNDAKEAYHRLQQELGAKQLEATLGDDTVSGDAKTQAVLDFIINEQKELRQLINEKVKNTPVARFVDRLSGWLSGGGVASRLAKGATIGLAAGVVGGALGLAAGAAGAGAAIAGLTAGAVKMAARFGVGYARHDAKQGRGLSEEMVDDDIDGLHGAIDGADDGKLLENALQRAAIITEDGTKQEQRKRRRSALIALGGIAFGATLAAGAGFVFDHLTVASYNATDGVSQPLGYDPAPRSAYGPPDLSGRTMPGDLMNTPASVVEQSSLPDYTTEARSIDWGEGWYQTFGEIGIPEDLHAELLQDTELMTQLQEMGLAYPDDTIGGWGIIMTEDGMMPPEALELIRRAALVKGVVLVA